MVEVIGGLLVRPIIIADGIFKEVQAFLSEEIIEIEVPVVFSASVFYSKLWWGGPPYQWGPSFS